MGLVHELAPQAELVERAKAWITGGGKGVAPWDEKGFKPPSGKVFSPAGMMTWPPANAIYRRETQDNYPGAKAILHCVYEGLQVGIDLGLKIESQYFAKVLRSREAHRDDPLAVHLHGRAQQGRPPAQGRARRPRSRRSACLAPASWARASAMSSPMPGSTSC